MVMKESCLIPQAKNWDEDLPEPTEEQRIYPRLIWVNEINDIWMEIPRYENITWGGLWFFAIISFFPLCIVFISIHDLGFSYNSFLNVMFFLFLFQCLFFVFEQYYSFLVALPSASTVNARKSMSMNISAASGPGSAGRQPSRYSTGRIFMASGCLWPGVPITATVFTARSVNRGHMKWWTGLS